MSSAILSAALSLPNDERIALIQGILDSLKASAPATPTKPAKALKVPDAPAKPKAPTAEPKEPSWWVKATAHVRAVLKPATDAHNAALTEGAKKITGTAVMSVASALKKASLLADGLMPSDAQILEAFRNYVANPPEPKAGSTSSTASGGSKPKAAKVPLTEEEATAVRAAKAAKAKATREANKAKKAAPVVEPFTDMPWAHEGHTYLRIENSLWDAGTDVWVGVYDPETNSIDTTAPEPERTYA